MISPNKIPYPVFRSSFAGKALVTNPGITDETHLRYILEVIDYINKNYSKDITLAEITRQAYVSKFHFSRIFKKHTSFSPYQYLIEVRLNHAQGLLRYHSYPIKEVADRCGFNRLDYFSALFKKRFKCNPTQYRENNAATTGAKTPGLRLKIFPPQLSRSL